MNCQCALAEVLCACSYINRAIKIHAHISIYAHMNTFSVLELKKYSLKKVRDIGNSAEWEAMDAYKFSFQF